MSTRIVHWKREPFDLYCGRNGEHYGIPAEKIAVDMGNPFEIGKDGTRAEVIEKHKAYARERVAQDPVWRENVGKLYGKRLGCWCVPNACHCDFLAELASMIRKGML